MIDNNFQYISGHFFCKAIQVKPDFDYNDIFSRERIKFSITKEIGIDLPCCKVKNSFGILTALDEDYIVFMLDDYFVFRKDSFEQNFMRIEQ